MMLRIIGWTLIGLGLLPFLSAFLSVYLAGFFGCIGDVSTYDCAFLGMPLGNILGRMTQGFLFLLPGAVAFAMGLVLLTVSRIRNRRTRG